MTGRNLAAAIERVDVSVYRIPTDFPEADGTYTWESTTLVLVEATAWGMRGLGYTYADTATGRLIQDTRHPTGEDENRHPSCRRSQPGAGRA